jgi:DNA transposition AAA+ family ATPase
MTNAKTKESNQTYDPTRKDSPDRSRSAGGPDSVSDDSITQSVFKSNGQGHRIAGDVVNRATADLPDHHRSVIRRLHAYYIEEGLSLSELAKQLDISPATVGLIFKGTYDAALDSMVKKIAAFFDLLDKRAKGRKLNFIETSLTRRIWNICDSSLEFQKVGFIFGEQQVGKTSALLAYQAAHNHGSTIYVTVPTGGNISNFLMELARKLRISDQVSTARLRERIKAAFDDRMLLIVDEASRAIPLNGNSVRKIETIDYIREIFYDKQCGLVICGTDIFYDQMENGPLQKFLKQIKRRRLCTMRLPSKPTQADLDTFAAAYGLPPSANDAREVEKQMIADEGLGMWLTVLRMGAKLASERHQAMGWPHVIAARAALKSLENPQ